MPSWRAIRLSALKVPLYMGALPPLARPMRMPMCCVCSRVFTTHRGFVTYMNFMPSVHLPGRHRRVYTYYQCTTWGLA